MRHGFSYLEVMVVVLVLGILAAVAVPRFTGVQHEAETIALEASLAGVRSGLSAFRTRQALAGATPLPTLEQLTEPGTVLGGEVPPNPFTGLRTVQAVSSHDAGHRSVINPSVYGWNYFVDLSTDPPRAVFYANSEHPTIRTTPSGDHVGANRL